MIHWAHNMSYTFYNVPYGGHQKYAWVYNMMVIVLEPFIKKFFIYIRVATAQYSNYRFRILQYQNLSNKYGTHIFFLLQLGIFQNDPLD